MSIKQELKALGAADDYCKYVEQLTKQDFTLADLVLPLVLQLGHARAEHQRLFAKHLQQVRELDAKNRRIANLTKEKLDWEATNHKRNEYIEGLKKAKKDGCTNDMKSNPPELQAVYYAWRAIMGYKVPEPEQPYVPFRDKTTWAIGDRVRIDEHLKGTVHTLSRKDSTGVTGAGILTADKGGVQEIHWLVRRRSFDVLEYQGHYTWTTK